MEDIRQLDGWAYQWMDVKGWMKIMVNWMEVGQMNEGWISQFAAALILISLFMITIFGGVKFKF